MPHEASSNIFTDPAFSDSEFCERVQCCSHEELAQCVRLLGMYLALFKRQFGELDVSACARFAGNDTSEYELAQLMAEGMDEASAMLMMIKTESPDPRMPASEDDPLLN
ncbi:MAG: hypothetical protein HYR49_10600 [Gammaproteobacteria bacterium]|nr:hypothetical protein [Gammaproteobacteria bacterium]